MSELLGGKLHVTFASGADRDVPAFPRCYTLTHSDATGDLYLTIGPDYDWQQIGGLYTRLMRDEVLAEWQEEASGPALHVHCHISGGLVVGTAGWRDAIFRRHLPTVLDALRIGDARLLEIAPPLSEAPIWVHFHARQATYNRVEPWGRFGESHDRKRTA